MKNQTSVAFIGASWLAAGVGILSYLVGLWNSDMLLSEKGYYFIVLLYGLFSAISIQKVVRDRLEGIPVTDIYYAICWFSAIGAIILLIVGLWNASMFLSEKGFYAMSFLLSLFASIVVQKNTRDRQIENESEYSSFKNHSRSVEEQAEKSLTYSESM